MGGFLRYRCDFLQQDVFEGMEEKADGAHQLTDDDDFGDDSDIDLDDFM